MIITLIDHNSKGVETMIKALGICRGNKCTRSSLDKALDAKPVPHMSVLEFGWVCLLVDGVSVKTRIQLIRSRLYSTMERSTRSLNMSNEGLVVPDTVKDKQSFTASLLKSMIEYDRSIERGESFEDSSYLLPLAITTKFTLAGNLRIWFEYFQKRLCKKHVQDEHYRMAFEMWNIICELFPIMQKAHPCKACGTCKEW